MGKNPIVSVAYENEMIQQKNLPYIKCVLRHSCVVHGPIYGRFMGCTLNGFLSLYKVYQVCGLQRIGPTDPTETIVFLRYKSLYFERYVTVPMVIQSNL